MVSENALMGLFSPFFFLFFFSMSFFGLRFVLFFPIWLLLRKGAVEFVNSFDISMFRLSGNGDSLILDMRKTKKRVIDLGMKDLLCLIGGYRLESNWKAKKKEDLVAANWGFIRLMNGGTMEMNPSGLYGFIKNSSPCPDLEDKDLFLERF